MEPHHWQNLVVAVLVGLVLWGLRVAHRSDLWRQAGRELVRRRPLAIGVVVVYVGVALLASITWIGGDTGACGALAKHQPRSVIDRLFPCDFQERSYSAPLASAEFYGGAE